MQVTETLLALIENNQSCIPVTWWDRRSYSTHGKEK